MEVRFEVGLCFGAEEYVGKRREVQGVVVESRFVRSGKDELLLEIELQGSNRAVVAGLAPGQGKGQGTLRTGEYDKLDPTEETVDLHVCFTTDERSLPIGPLQYCYPAREFVLSSEDCDFHCPYGYRFPLSFVSALYENNGLTLIFDDQQQSSVGVKKRNGRFQFDIKYRHIPLQGGRRTILLHFHSGDWHEGFKRYKSWYRRKYNEPDKLDERLRSAFHIRRYFFHKELCNAVIYDGESYQFRNLYEDDQVEAGGVDAALLFDFAFTPQTNIRCGNSRPFTNLKNLHELNAQLQDVKRESNLAVFAYFDPYLIQDGSDFDKAYRDRLPILNEKGDRHHIWGTDQWHPCLTSEEWQEESRRYLAEVVENLAVDGLYLDEVGNGELFVCHDPAHGHEVPLDQNRAEYQYTNLLKKEFPDKLFLCEFFPADSNIHLFPAVLSDSRTIIDICRFAFPYKKIFKIINCDRPIGNNTWDINKIFFNGMGLWFDNDLHNEEWYAPEVKRLIKKHYRILKSYSAIFESDDVEPLVAIDSGAILVNRFSLGEKTIFTFLNVTEKNVESYLNLNDEHVSVYDIYNHKKCDIIIQNGRKSVRIQLAPHSAGCILALNGTED